MFGNLGEREWEKERFPRGNTLETMINKGILIT
jgi:hypothetical protein